MLFKSFYKIRAVVKSTFIAGVCSYLRYNKDKHCGFVSILLQLRLV